MRNNILDFELQKGFYTVQFIQKGIHSFHEACQFIASQVLNANYTVANREDQKIDGPLSNAAKHSILAKIAEENFQDEIELVAGIFMMSSETHPEFQTFLDSYKLITIPEIHCYLRYKGERFDFSSNAPKLPLIEKKITREQRIEPHQIGEWRMEIHKDYLKRWISRKPEINQSFEEIYSKRNEFYKTL